MFFGSALVILIIPFSEFHISKSFFGHQIDSKFFVNRCTILRDLLNLIHNSNLTMISFQKLLVIQRLLLYLTFFAYSEQMNLWFTETSEICFQITRRNVKSYFQLLR